MSDLNVFQIEKPWGNFRQFTHNTSSTVKIITVNPNESLSLQTHAKRSEFWYVIDGDGIALVGDAEYQIKRGSEIKIQTGEKHRIQAGPSGLRVLEISLGDFDEEDIIRLEDKYNRA